MCPLCIATATQVALSTTGRQPAQSESFAKTKTSSFSIKMVRMVRRTNHE